MGDIRFVETIDDALELRRWLGERRPILGLDTETGGLDPYAVKLRLVQFGDTTGGWAVPAEDWRGFLRDTLNAYDADLCLHNARFDAHFLREHLGVELAWDRVYDTEVEAHICEPAGRHGLKYLATKRVHPGAAGGQKALNDAMRKGKWNWATVPVNLPEYWAYGVMDTILDAMLHENLSREIEQRGLGPVLDLERGVTKVLYKMERRGCQLDLTYCHEKHGELMAYCDEVRQWARDSYGIPNLTANRQISRALIADGVQLTARTKTGEYQLTEPILSALEHPLAQAVVAVRKATKIAGAYFLNFINTGGDTGVIHPNIRQVAARTGRMSITNPAMQTLPKGPVVRDAFIARPGYKLLSVDYEQIEARIFASEAEELPMIQAILDYDAGSGVDLHTFVARVVYGDPTIIKSDPRRNLAKNTIFCTIYGGGAAKIAETAGVELEVAEAFLAKFLETFPGVRRFQKATESLGRQREKSEGVAYTHSVSGRYHSLLPDEGVYKLTNYRIQGSAADVLKERMVSLDNAGFGDYMLLPVHDEVVFEMPDEWALDAVPHIKTCMEDFESFAVPLLVSASDPHPRWGACK